MYWKYQRADKIMLLTFLVKIRAKLVATEMNHVFQVWSWTWFLAWDPGGKWDKETPAASIKFVK